MNQTAITENLLTAIETVAQSVVDGIAYDKTVICTIVDDSQKDVGKYVVSDGSGKFSAYSETTTYKNKDKVMVLVPNGDFTEQKVIVGKQIDDTTPFAYTQPFDTMVKCTDNLIPEKVNNNNGNGYWLTANTKIENKEGYSLVENLPNDIKIDISYICRGFLNKIDCMSSFSINVKIALDNNKNTFIDEDISQNNFLFFSNEELNIDDEIFIVGEIFYDLLNNTVKNKKLSIYSKNPNKEDGFFISNSKDTYKIIFNCGSLVLKQYLKGYKFTENQKPTFGISMKHPIYETYELGKYHKAFNRLGIKANFQSLLEAENVNSGDYGLRLDIYHKNKSLEDKEDQEKVLSQDTGFDSKKEYYLKEGDNFNFCNIKEAVSIIENEIKIDSYSGSFFEDGGQQWCDLRFFTNSEDLMENQYYSSYSLVQAIKEYIKQYKEEIKKQLEFFQIDKENVKVKSYQLDYTEMPIYDDIPISFEELLDNEDIFPNFKDDFQTCSLNSQKEWVFEGEKYWYNIDLLNTDIWKNKVYVPGKYYYKNYTLDTFEFSDGNSQYFQFNESSTSNKYQSIIIFSLNDERVFYDKNENILENRNQREQCAYFQQEVYYIDEDNEDKIWGYFYKPKTYYRLISEDGKPLSIDDYEDNKNNSEYFILDKSNGFDKDKSYYSKGYVPALVTYENFPSLKNEIFYFNGDKKQEAKNENGQKNISYYKKDFERISNKFDYFDEITFDNGIEYEQNKYYYYDNGEWRKDTGANATPDISYYNFKTKDFYIQTEDGSPYQKVTDKDGFDPNIDYYVFSGEAVILSEGSAQGYYSYNNNQLVQVQGVQTKPDVGTTYYLPIGKKISITKEQYEPGKYFKQTTSNLKHYIYVLAEGDEEEDTEFYKLENDKFEKIPSSQGYQEGSYKQIYIEYANKDRESFLLGSDIDKIKISTVEYNQFDFTENNSYEPNEYYFINEDGNYELSTDNGFDSNKTYFYEKQDYILQKNLKYEDYIPNKYYVKKEIPEEKYLTSFYLNTEDMLGDPYNFSGAFAQEKVFDISSIGDIICAKLYFYQDNNFRDKYLNQLIPSENENLYVSDIEMYFGFDISEVNKEFLQIYSFNSLDYRATPNNYENLKTINLKWVHMDGNKPYVLDKDNIQTFIQDKIDEKIDSLLNEENKDEIDIQKVLDNGKISIKQDNSYSPIENRIYFERKEEASPKLEGNCNIQYYLNGSTDFQKNYKYFQRIIKPKENSSTLRLYSPVNTEIDTSTNEYKNYLNSSDYTFYQKLPNNILKQIDLTEEFVEENNNITIQVVGFKQDDNGAYQEFFEQVYPTEETLPELLYNYYIQSEDYVSDNSGSINVTYTKVEDLSNYEPNKYYYLDLPLENTEIKWFRYVQGEPTHDDHAGVYWKPIEKIDKNIDILSSGLRAILLDDFTVQLDPDYVLNKTERIKVVVEYDGNTYYSNELEFTNQDEVANVPTAQQDAALRMQFLDESMGNYYLYAENNYLIDSSEATKNREVTLLFDLDDYSSLSLLNDAEQVHWIFPIGDNTMIRVNTALTNGTYYEENGFGHIINTNKENQYKLYYQIDNYYRYFKANNTLVCNIVKDGILYGVTQELSFGRLGNSGTEYTLVLDLLTPDNVLTVNQEAYEDLYYKTFQEADEIKKDNTMQYYVLEKITGKDKNGKSITYEEYKPIAIEDWNGSKGTPLYVYNKYLPLNNTSEIVSNYPEKYFRRKTAKSDEIDNTKNKEDKRKLISDDYIIKEYCYYDYENNEIFRDNGQQFKPGSWNKCVIIYYIDEYVETNLRNAYYENIIEATLYDQNHQQIDISTYDISWELQINSSMFALEHKSNNSCVLNPLGSGQIDNEFIIVKATLSGFGDYDLISYLPVAIRANYIPTRFQGPTQVIYSSTGLPNYYKDEINLYYNDEKGNEKIFPYYTGKTENYQVAINKDGISDKDKEYSFYPKINYGKDINTGQTKLSFIPISTYVDGVDLFAIQIWFNGQVIWQQPILYLQNRYFSSTINKWDGNLNIDEDKNTILAKMIGAGSKNRQNQFSGVIMGDWTNNVDAEDIFSAKVDGYTYTPKISTMATQTGLYGFHEGETSFGFMEDGTGFIGKSGSGRIYFNGNSSVITSGRWYNDRTGMYLDIDDGFLLMQSKSTESGDHNGEYRYIKFNSKANPLSYRYSDNIGESFNAAFKTPAEIPVPGDGRDNDYPFVIRGDVNNYTMIGWRGDLILHGTHKLKGVSDAVEASYVETDDTEFQSGKKYYEKNGKEYEETDDTEFQSGKKYFEKENVEEESGGISLNASAKKFPLNISDHYGVGWDGSLLISTDKITNVYGAKSSDQDGYNEEEDSGGLQQVVVEGVDAQVVDPNIVSFEDTYGNYLKTSSNTDEYVKTNDKKFQSGKTYYEIDGKKYKETEDTTDFQSDKTYYEENEDEYVKTNDKEPDPDKTYYEEDGDNYVKTNDKEPDPDKTYYERTANKSNYTSAGYSLKNRWEKLFKSKKAFNAANFGYTSAVGEDQWEIGSDIVLNSGTSLVEDNNYDYSQLKSSFKGFYATPFGDLYLSKKLVIGNNFSTNKDGYLRANSALFSDCNADVFKLKYTDKYGPTGEEFDDYPKNNKNAWLSVRYGDSRFIPTVGLIGVLTGYSFETEEVDLYRERVKEEESIVKEKYIKITSEDAVNTDKYTYYYKEGKDTYIEIDEDEINNIAPNNKFRLTSQKKTLNAGIITQKDFGIKIDSSTNISLNARIEKATGTYDSESNFFPSTETLPLSSVGGVFISGKRLNVNMKHDILLNAKYDETYNKNFGEQYNFTLSSIFLNASDVVQQLGHKIELRRKSAKELLGTKKFNDKYGEDGEKIYLGEDMAAGEHIDIENRKISIEIPVTTSGASDYDKDNYNSDSKFFKGGKNHRQAIILHEEDKLQQGTYINNGFDPPSYTMNNLNTGHLGLVREDGAKTEQSFILFQDHFHPSYNENTAEPEIKIESDYIVETGKKGVRIAVLIKSEVEMELVENKNTVFDQSNTMEGYSYDEDTGKLTYTSKTGESTIVFAGSKELPKITIGDKTYEQPETSQGSESSQDSTPDYLEDDYSGVSNWEDFEEISFQPYPNFDKTITGKIDYRDKINSKLFTVKDNNSDDVYNHILLKRQSDGKMVDFFVLASQNLNLNSQNQYKYDDDCIFKIEETGEYIHWRYIFYQSGVVKDYQIFYVNSDGDGSTWGGALLDDGVGTLKYKYSNFDNIISQNPQARIQKVLWRNNNSQIEIEYKNENGETRTVRKRFYLTK